MAARSSPSRRTTRRIHPHASAASVASSSLRPTSSSSADSSVGSSAQSAGALDGGVAGGSVQWVRARWSVVRLTAERSSRRRVRYGVALGVRRAVAIVVVIARHCSRDRDGCHARNDHRGTFEVHRPLTVAHGALVPEPSRPIDRGRLSTMPGQCVLGVDLDGVVADHTRRFREIVAERRGVDPESLPMDRSWDFHEWGFAPDEYDWLHKLAVTEYDMIRTMPVIEGAADVLWRLSDAGIWLRIITHRLYVNWGHERAVGDTAAWLDEHRIPYRRTSVLPRGQTRGPGGCLHRRCAAQRQRPAPVGQHRDRVRPALQPAPRRWAPSRQLGGSGVDRRRSGCRQPGSSCRAVARHRCRQLPPARAPRRRISLSSGGSGPKASAPEPPAYPRRYLTAFISAHCELVTI